MSKPKNKQQEAEAKKVELRDIEQELHEIRQEIMAAFNSDDELPQDSEKK